MARERWGGVAAALGVASALAVAACGGHGNPGAAARSGAKPGAGKPPVLIGAGNFTEQLVLGQLYAQALRTRGYDVTLRPDVASAQLLHKALASGQIDGYAESTRTLLTSVAHIARRQSSARAAHATAKAFEARHGFDVLAATPFSDVDAVAVTSQFARRNRLRALGDLRRLRGLRLGGPREFETRLTAPTGLARTYGLAGVSFVALSIGQQYGALDAGRIQAANVSTTDPRLRAARYVLLDDPQHVLGFGNVVPIFNRRVIAAEGPDFARTVDAVSARLTLRAVRELKAAVEVEKASPAEAARRFLRAHRLAG